MRSSCFYFLINNLLLFIKRAANTAVITSHFGSHYKPDIFMLACIFGKLFKKNKKKDVLNPNYSKKHVNPKFTLLSIEAEEEEIVKLLHQLPSTSNFLVFDFLAPEIEYECFIKNQLCRFTCYCNSIISRVGDSLNFCRNHDTDISGSVLFSIDYFIEQKQFDKLVKPKTGKNVVIFKVNISKSVIRSENVLFSVPRSSDIRKFTMSKRRSRVPGKYSVVGGRAVAQQQKNANYQKAPSERTIWFRMPFLSVYILLVFRSYSRLGAKNHGYSMGS